MRAPSAPAHERGFSGRWLRWVGTVGLALTAALLTFAAKPVWKSVSPDELAETKPRLEADAPAEVVFWNYEMNDAEFARERRITEYIRYKIFVPEKAENLMRISDVTVTGSADHIDLRARLLLPDGRVQEFGQESIKERTLSKQANAGGFLGWLADATNPVVREKFLAVVGAEPGAIIEYQVTRSVRGQAVQALLVQREGVPIRKFEFKCQLLDSQTFASHVFMLNGQGAKLTQDSKTGLITLNAENLPSIAPEPFVGPVTDYALSVLTCYEPIFLDVVGRAGVPTPEGVDGKKLGPWAYYATMANWFERDHGSVTKRVKKLAADLVAGAKDDDDKAHRIHQYVATMFQHYVWRPGPLPTRRQPVHSLDDVLDWEKKPDLGAAPDDFLYLANALYQQAGLEAHTVQLPDRQFTHFRPDHISGVFLAGSAAAVRVGGTWRFSAPQDTEAIPFGMLPWRYEGQVALLSLDHRQEFIPVPLTPSDQSIITSIADLALDSEGTLSGECQRKYTGQTAVTLRGNLRGATAERRAELVAASFGLDRKTVEITAGNIENIEDADQPLVVHATLRWPGYATLTKERLVVRPSVFRTDGTSPFSATLRRHPIRIPYQWQEVDRVAIQLPEGFTPEAAGTPPVGPGKVLSYDLHLSYEPKLHTVRLRRDFTSNVIDAPTAAYPDLKSWYDRVALSDQHELVFTRHASASDPAKNGGQ